ncbi:hypothetical protein BHE74_00016589 [Ensete ventricosum]|uniref:Uncharacterized protein n=1 Tax=Ensete ventricosum TaxID=4639 RepID=A0A445MBT5_ENSVE|nr:hypothetical protein BHE74_00016589 [Ensete ventricosum]RZR71725.1 hypothetical protein BHM03_00006860 [Ensete ventricosum]
MNLNCCLNTPDPTLGREKEVALSIDLLPSVLEPDLDLLWLDVGENGTLPYELLPPQGARLRALGVDPLERLHLLRSVPHVLPRVHRRRGLLLPLLRFPSARNHRHLLPYANHSKIQSFPTRRAHHPQKPPALPFSRLFGSRRHITAPQKLAAAVGNPIFLSSHEAAIALRIQGGTEKKKKPKRRRLAFVLGAVSPWKFKAGGERRCAISSSMLSFQFNGLNKV